MRLPVPGLGLVRACGIFAERVAAGGVGAGPRSTAEGWPKTRAPFRLGRWGLLVNILGLIYGGAMLINFAWPRAASNPTPKQTGLALDFHIGFLNGIPILWTVFVVLAAIGVIYYLLVGRTKAFAPVIAPAGDDAPLVAGTAPQAES